MSITSDAVAERRGYMAVDWLVRVCLPKWLDLVPSLAEHAALLRSHPEISDDETAATASAALANVAWVAEKVAVDAAGNEDIVTDAMSDMRAVCEATGVTNPEVMESARAAARIAASSAQETAWFAAWPAAWREALAKEEKASYAAIAARTKANIAARTAAKDALKPTAEWLQASASDLLKRMREVK